MGAWDGRLVEKKAKRKKRDEDEDDNDDGGLKVITEVGPGGRMEGTSSPESGRP